MTEPIDVFKYLHRDSERSWYSEDEPVFGNNWEDCTPEEEYALRSLARRFVNNWLENDNQGFVIPRSEWGKDLLWALRVIMGETNRFTQVDVLLDTTMWNEGFEKADYPWLRLYTDNSAWADSLPEESEMAIPGSFWGQNFIFQKTLVPAETVMDDVLAAEWREQNPDQAGDEITYGMIRFPGLVKGSSEELQALLEKRLSDWDGV